MWGVMRNVGVMGGVGVGDVGVVQALRVPAVTVGAAAVTERGNGTMSSEAEDLAALPVTATRPVGTHPSPSANAHRGAHPTAAAGFRTAFPCLTEASAHG